MKSHRAQAVKILKKVLFDHSSLDNAIEMYLSVVPSDKRALVKQWCFGVCRFYFLIEALLNPLLKKDLSRQVPELACVLSLATYQLLDTDIPKGKIVNESVSCLSALKLSWAEGLVNGILRNLVRQQDSLLLAAKQDPVARFQHPDWMIKWIEKAWPNDWENILEANNQKAPMSLRVNRQAITRADYLKMLEAQGMSAQISCLSSDGLTLDQPCSVEALPGFADGLVSVQSIVAQCAAQLLKLKPGLSVLDAQAAPGGKTTHLLECEPRLVVTALDKSEARLKQLVSNCERLNVIPKDIVASSAQDFAAKRSARFDRILCDVPCSATGVIRRHPDIKLLRRESDLMALMAEQMDILNSLWPLVKPGGLILYATCSIFPEENADLIATFVQKSGAVHLDCEFTVGTKQVFGHQFLPNQKEMDGFYYALLSKS